MKFKKYSIAAIILVWICSCNKPETSLLQLKNSSEIGIDFVNQINETDTLNVLSFANIYNGSGIAVADFNNDGLPDLVFGGNMVSSRLYLNQTKNGKLKFKDISEEALFYTNRWVSGVNVVDINQDGWVDIYLSVTGPESANKQNYLFINQGKNEENVPVFKEEASKYNLNDSSSTTQSAFFDFDRDGDLDVFMIVNKAENYYGGIEPTLSTNKSDDRNRTDRLYRNNAIECKEHSCEELFTDISKEAGVNFPGYSLGVAISDLNNDTWPDIYVANDFVSNDLLYINNKDGTFSNKVTEYLAHTSFSGMGVDIADINNDGNLDIIEVDMIPEDDQRLKSMWSAINYDKFHITLSAGYAPQFSRNTLQLNQGVIDGRPLFSDISYLAGIHHTDWSWSVLLVDFNLDGYKDIFIANGYQRDMQDLDFVHYMQKPTSYFGTESNQQHFLNTVINLPPVNVPNYIFTNNGDLTFENKTRSLIGETTSISHGAATADLDNDGDFDLVVCNNNTTPFIYQNTLNTKIENGQNYCKVNLLGPKNNRQAIGARVIAYGNENQVLEKYTARGFQSASDEHLLFSLGEKKILDSLKIIWPDGTFQMEYNLPANAVSHINYQLNQRKANQKDQVHRTLFSEKDLFSYEHSEYDFVDFHHQRLIPKKYSQNGPAMAASDIDGNGLEDLVISGAKDYPTLIFWQNKKNSFRKSAIHDSEKYEDQGILIADFDGNGSKDLFVTSGGVEYGYNSKFYQDRIYLNDGMGNLNLSRQFNPRNSTVVTGADFDKDNDLDLFIGGGVLPGRYPKSEKCGIFINETNGSDNIVNEFFELDSLGIVSDALWTDIDNDGWIDLIVVGEWMPITFFINNKGQNFIKKSVENTSGWWNSINGCDLDNDGDIDYILGNLGLNSKYKAEKNEPIKIYIEDFDENGSLDPLITQFSQGEEVLVHPRDEIIEQMPGLRKNLYTYADYAKLELNDLFKIFNVKRPNYYQVELLHSILLINKGNFEFQIKPLPNKAQISPIYGIMTSDLNNNQLLDLVVSGNSYAAEVDVGFYDASFGNVLLNQDLGKWNILEKKRDGLYLQDDLKSLIEYYSGNEVYLIGGSNKGAIKSYQFNASIPNVIRLNPDDAYALIELVNGDTRKQEFYYGSSYYSQSSRILKVNHYMKSINIVKYNGSKRKYSRQDFSSPTVTYEIN